MTKRIVYKWSKEDFIKAFNEMNLKSSFKEIKGRNAVLVRVADFEEMKCLFGYGRSFWAIAVEERYWERYVSDKNRWQFVYLNFDVKEFMNGKFMDGSGFAFTYDPNEDIFTNAASRNDHSITRDNEKVAYILKFVLDCPLEIIKNK